MIRRMLWKDVAGIMHKGGTNIGTARSQEFRTRAGRLQAARNLVALGINNLVVIGGDGSLTGANLLREEWPSLLAELQQQQLVTADQAAALKYLCIVGLVGSIDNDMCGTDITIGTDTALKRIIEACDAIASTAESHRRSFVLEVMGRNCGYLALSAAIACGADWVLIPECPPDVDDWESVMCAELERGRRLGRKMSIVIVAEGAKDRNGKPIASEYVRRVLHDRLGHDARVTVLGHVQRGGAPTAFCRYLGTIQGAHAISVILKSDPSQPPLMIGLRGHEIVTLPLMECVAGVRGAGAAVGATPAHAANARRSPRPSRRPWSSGTMRSRCSCVGRSLRRTGPSSDK